MVGRRSPVVTCLAVLLLSLAGAAGICAKPPQLEGTTSGATGKNSGKTAEEEQDLSIRRVPFLGYTYVPDVAHYGKHMGMDMPVARAYKIYRRKSVVFKGDAKHPNEPSAAYSQDDNYMLLSPEGSLEKGWRPKDAPLVLGDITSHVRKPAKADPLMRLSRAQPPVLVIAYYPGGAHADSDYTFLSVTKEKLTPVGKAKTLPLSFVDVDGDGVYEMRGQDRTFKYWHGAAYVESYSPPVFLQIKNGQLALDPKKQKEKPLPAGYMDGLVRTGLKSISSSRSGEVPKGHFELSAPIWASMLELVYTGNGDRIGEYLDKVWPKGKLAMMDDSKRFSRPAFEADFKAKLKQSPYWEGLKSLNGWTN